MLIIDLNVLSKDNRYADDLSFSSYSKITDELIGAICSIKSTAGFEINKKKLRITPSASRQTVTGLTGNQKVNPCLRLIKNILSMRHDLDTNGLEAATQRHFKLKTPTSLPQQTCPIRRFCEVVKGEEGAYAPIHSKNPSH